MRKNNPIIDAYRTPTHFEFRDMKPPLGKPIFNSNVHHKRYNKAKDYVGQDHRPKYIRLMVQKQ